MLAGLGALLVPGALDQKDRRILMLWGELRHWELWL